MYGKSWPNDEKKKKKKRFPQLKNFDEFHQQSLFFYKIYQITTSYWLENSRGEDEFEGGGTWSVIRTQLSNSANKTCQDKIAAHLQLLWYLLSIQEMVITTSVPPLFPWSTKTVPPCPKSDTRWAARTKHRG